MQNQLIGTVPVLITGNGSFETSQLIIKNTYSLYRLIIIVSLFVLSFLFTMKSKIVIREYYNNRLPQGYKAGYSILALMVSPLIVKGIVIPVMQQLIVFSQKYGLFLS